MACDRGAVANFAERPAGLGDRSPTSPTASRTSRNGVRSSPAALLALAPFATDIHYLGGSTGSPSPTPAPPPGAATLRSGGPMSPRAVLAVCALALVAPLPAAAQSGGHRAEIDKAVQAWQKAFNAGDIPAVAAFYTKDALLMPPGADPVTGPAG